MTHHHILRKGFTLAEVLITIGIIGIVAALTIPTLIGNYQKKKIATIVKEEYSKLNLTLKNAEAENGDATNWGYTSYDDLELWIKTYILPYIKYTKICSSDCNLGGYHSLGYNPANNNANPRTPRYTVILNNGIAWCFYRSQSPYHYQTKIVIYANKSFAKQKYWYAGIDAFSFIFDYREKNPHIRPFQVPTVKNGEAIYPLLDRKELLKKETPCGCAQNSNACYGYNIAGDYCSTVLLMDNWEFKKDYPWKRF